MVGATLQTRARGFTLIELMVIVSIIGILAAIAIPSYRRYVITNAERETQAKMLQLELQLERWRASALTYRGFVPQKADGRTRGYDNNNDGKTIYVPTGSDATNHRYSIELVDGDNTSQSLAATSSDPAPSTGRSWKMLATPNSNGSAATGHNFMMTSTGLRCQNTAAVKITDPSCGTGQETW